MARLLYFASLQDLMGCREESLDLPAEWSVADLLDHLEARQPRLQALRGRYRVAVDLEMADEARSLKGAGEVALIPPVSGGHGAWVRLDHEPIDLNLVTEAVRRPDCGAVLTFLGTVRDSYQNQPVERIDYSAYEAMAKAELQRLAVTAQSRLALGQVAVWHRLGPVAAGEASVAVAVSSPHRKEAFELGQWLIDALKAEVPIWKKEVGPDGAVWIEGDARVSSQGFPPPISK